LAQVFRLRAFEFQTLALLCHISVLVQMADDGLSAMPQSSRATERPSARLRTLAGQVMQTLPFLPEAVDGDLDLEDHAYLELKQNSRVYSLACAYIALNGDVRSFRYSPEMSEGDTVDSSSGSRRTSSLTTIGLGFFRFSWRDHDLHALHQTVGQPVGAGNNIDVYTSLVLFAPLDAPAVLGRFCQELEADSEKSHAGFVNVFEWNPINQFWQARVVAPARPMESVILEQEVKDRLLDDLQEFLGHDTRKWYKEHGIQHKRGYLFHGVPGSGKTSLVQAIAGHFEHNLCHVHLTHPRLTDESLRAAMNQAPRRSLIVFEDIDAIFGREREKLLLDSTLSFSGLLNALDGVGKADGQIIVLTTNHRDRLNPALIRNGRADVHIEFSHASDEQLCGMFRRFYPLCTERMGQQFVERLRAALDGRPVTTAALQHFFIMQRRSTAGQAIDFVQDVVDEIEMRADEARLLEQELRKRQS